MKEEGLVSNRPNPFLDRQREKMLFVQRRSRCTNNTLSTVVLYPTRSVRKTGGFFEHPFLLYKERRASSHRPDLALDRRKEKMMWVQRRSRCTHIISFPTVVPYPGRPARKPKVIFRTAPDLKGDCSKISHGDTESTEGRRAEGGCSDGLQGMEDCWQSKPG